MKSTPQYQWIAEYFPNHEVFEEDESRCAWSDDYVEIYLYKSQLSDEPLIRIINVELVMETLLVAQIPPTKEQFFQLLELAGFEKI